MGVHDGARPVLDIAGQVHGQLGRRRERAGVTEAEVERLVDFGVLVARDGVGPFLETDVQKVRLARACEQAGLPMEGIASAIRAGRLSFAFLEAAPFRRWAVRSARTY